jgi:4a-hydroxytetrahydrobiopterin dehydratase
MDMLSRAEIAEARLTDWRKLAQGLHARYLVDDFGAGARFVAAVGAAGDTLGHHPSVSIGAGHSVAVIELGLDTTRSATIAPVWAALLTGDAGSQGRGTPGDGQHFHVEVYVPHEAAEQRVSAAVAAGGTVVDDSDAPSLTVVADQDGNTAVVCVAETRPAEREP